MNRYTVNSLIGEGSFGRVFKATRKDDKQTVAIKIISKRGRSIRELKNLRRECEIQARLKHPNVIEMLESFETKNELVVVTEFALIDLHRYMSRKGALSEEQAQKLICHLVSALYYLHSNRILHRDLKPQNVMLDEDLRAKLCDFGLARNMTIGTHVLTSIKGTPLYMAPELLAERPYDHLADLWSLGCISYESLAAQPPFCTTSILRLVKMIKHEEVKWPSFLSSDCRSFLQGLLEKDPLLRASWAQIMCHPFVEGKLYIKPGIKAENSPFINPQKNKMKNKGSTGKEILEQLPSVSEKLKLNELTNNQDNQENLTTSKDSINAIPASDIELLETDNEDNLNRIDLPFVNESLNKENIDIADTNKMRINGARDVTIPMINSQTCFVSGNDNMILNRLNDNFSIITDNQNKSNHNCNNNISNNINKSECYPMKSRYRNKDLEKRKLSQNLDNFSVRLGQSIPDTRNVEQQLQQQQQQQHQQHQQQEQQRKIIDNKDITKLTSQLAVDASNLIENSPPSLLPGWDSCDDSQSPPIENDEWLAFLHRTMQELLDGEMDSLKQQNLVSIIVAPLRNKKATPKVLESVAQLLALPFISNEPINVLERIKAVYIDVKLVPNLMYASKLLIYQHNTHESTSSTPSSSTDGVQQSHQAPRIINELNNEQMKCISRLYELICYLVHLRQQFLLQFCDAIMILAGDELMINFLKQDLRNVYTLRSANCILALLGCILRELPENAELVERIIFSDKVNLIDFLRDPNELMRLRICMLIRLLGRFSLRALQRVWTIELKKALESLTEDTNVDVQKEAENALVELCQFSFYT